MLPRDAYTEDVFRGRWGLSSLRKQNVQEQEIAKVLTVLKKKKKSEPVQKWEGERWN